MIIAMSNEEIIIIEPKYHGIILGKEGQGLKEIIRQAQGSTRERVYVKLYALRNSFYPGALILFL